MKKQLVSVIIPAYNAEKFIANSIESVMQQSYSNVELILVNDGSTDSTDEICKRYALDCSKIKYIQQENRGEGGARNTGLDIAEGEYIVFLDADDSLPYDAVDKMMKNIGESSLVIGGLEREDDKKTEFFKPKSKVVEGDELARSVIYDAYFINCIGGSLFKADIIKEKNIRFNFYSYGADTFFTYTFLKYVESITFISDVVYHVNVVDGSMSRRIVRDSWKYMRGIYELGKDLFDATQKELDELLFLRSVKTVLILEAEISRQSFYTACEELKSYINANRLTFESNLGIYNRIVISLLINQNFGMLYRFMRVRIKFLKP